METSHVWTNACICGAHLHELMESAVIETALRVWGVLWYISEWDYILAERCVTVTSLVRQYVTLALAHTRFWIPDGGGNFPSALCSAPTDRALVSQWEIVIVHRQMLNLLFFCWTYLPRLYLLFVLIYVCSKSSAVQCE